LENLSGVPSEQAVGYHLKSLPSPWNDLLSGFALAQDSHIHHMEITLNGRPRWFNLHKATVLDQEQQIDASGRTSLVMLLEDLTDLEILEAELAHSDRLASIGRLAAGVAHEIGNPVTGIHSLAQNLRDEHDKEEIDQSVEAILQQTRRISNIVKSLMNFSRSGEVGIDHREFTLADIIEESVRLVQLTHKSKEMRWIIDCSPDLTLVGDKQRFSQVLVNLLTNACDASETDNTIEIIAQELEAEVKIEIIDSGKGIPLEIQEFIFEPFFTTKVAGEGTGLGLSMAHKIIQDHNGQISIDSAPDTGTRVKINLPKTTNT
jgi:signal transduction histidine kinase